jgi:hypothetical protein
MKAAFKIGAGPLQDGSFQIKRWPKRRYRPVRLLTAFLYSYAVAAAYCRAAARDERLGFPCTAAMEWRTAAELFTPNGILAEYCWGEWERIMHLPRRCAIPLDENAIPGKNVVEIASERRLSRAVLLSHHRRKAA